MTYISTYHTNSPGVPCTITQMARAHHLGKRRAAYGYNTDIPGMLISTLAGHLVSSVLFAGFLILVIYIYHGGITDQGAYIGAIILLVLGILFLIITSVGNRRSYKNASVSWLACVYNAGCIIQQYNQEAQILRWDEIEAVWLVWGKARLSGEDIVESYRIQRADGYEVTLTRAGGPLNRLTKVINVRLSERLMSHVLAQYNTSQTVVFGPCGINSEGFCLLEQNRKLLPWACLDRSEMKETCLLLYENGQKLPWTSIPTATIPNFAILMELIEVVRSDADSNHLA